MGETEPLLGFALQLTAIDRFTYDCRESKYLGLRKRKTSDKGSELARFFLIDQSLVSRGGHHYDYTTCIVGAANELGFETIVAANRGIDSNLGIPDASVIPAFSETVYQRDSCLSGLRHLKRARSIPIHPTPSTNSWQRTKAAFAMRRFRRRRARLIHRFATECQAFFDQFPLNEDSHVFLTAISELELMGLAQYLRSNPHSVLATWHLQFHFNVFDGRPPEYETQSATRDLAREAFAVALNDLNIHRICFYTTSQQLADQYNRLNVGTFISLPYPVATEFALRPQHAVAIDGETEQVEMKSPSNRSPTPPTENPTVKYSTTAAKTPGSGQRPIRFLCPGQIRREKGCCDYLQPLVDQLWPTHFSNGKIRITIQRPKKKILRKQKIELQRPRGHDNPTHDGHLQAHQGSFATENNTSHNIEPFEYHPHPLGRSKYIDLLRSADCGLLMYDSRAYYSRRAGVLGEMLSCGKPLIVPAGSWLASQISEPIFAHADQVSQRFSANSRFLEMDDLEWTMENAPAAGGAISFDGAKHPFTFSINRRPEEQLIKIAFRWQWPKVEGTYCRIRVTQSDGNGQQVGHHEQVIGHRDKDKLPNGLFRILEPTETIHVELSNCYQQSAVMVNQLQIAMLAPNVETQISNPATTSLGANKDGHYLNSKPNHSIQDTPISSEHRRPKTETSFNLASSRPDQESIALGKVGIIVADQSQLANAVVEMVDHFAHYDESAKDFSQRWFALHHPKRTIAHLIGASVYRRIGNAV